MTTYDIPPAGAPALHPIPTEYHRPATLFLPERPPKIVYLDLNHWVSLAKAYAGHPDGASYRAALDVCTAPSDKREVVFPLADAIYYEVSRIGAYRKRHDLAEVMRRVSGYLVITSRSMIAHHEVEALLDRLVGPRTEPLGRVRYLDWGVARAFGKQGGFRIRSDTADFPSGPEGPDQFMWQAELDLNRKSIEGPDSAEEEAALRKNGWDPYVAHRSAVQRAQQESAQAARLAAEPEWRRGRIRDVIAANEVWIELTEKMTRGLVARDATKDPILSGDPAVRQAFAEMPSFDVAVTLKASYHRDGTRTWKPNDVNDIDIMGSTLPYCDIVVTDKAVVDHVARTGLASRCGSTVLSRLDDLLRLL